MWGGIQARARRVLERQPIDSRRPVTDAAPHRLCIHVHTRTSKVQQTRQARLRPQPGVTSPHRHPHHAYVNSTPHCEFRSIESSSHPRRVGVVCMRTTTTGWGHARHGACNKKKWRAGHGGQPTHKRQEGRRPCRDDDMQSATARSGRPSAGL